MKSKKKSLYKKGRKYEYLALSSLKKECQLVGRSAGSKGLFDVWALKFTPEAINLYLIQVKAKKSGQSLTGALSPSEKKSLEELLTPKGKVPINLTAQLSIQVWLWCFRKGWKKFEWENKSKQWKPLT